MRSVERRFREFQGIYPNHSSLIVFGRTIKGQKFSRRMVAFYFSKLVEKDDYPRNEKKSFVEFYYRMTNLLEDSSFRGQNALFSDFKVNRALRLA